MGRRQRSSSPSASPITYRKQPRLGGADAESGRLSPTPPPPSATQGRLAFAPAGTQNRSRTTRASRLKPLPHDPPRLLAHSQPSLRSRRRSPSPPLSISSDIDSPAASSQLLRRRSPIRQTRPLRIILSDSGSDQDAIDSGLSDADEPPLERPSPVLAMPFPSPAADTGDDIRRTLFASPWATAFPPSSLPDVAVHSAKVNAVHGWMRDALLGPPGLRRFRRVLCIRGPTGSGKSALLDALSREADLRITPKAPVFGTRISASGKSPGAALCSQPIPSDPDWGFRMVHFDAHRLPSSSRGMWEGGEAAHLASAFPAFLHEAVSGRSLTLAPPPAEDQVPKAVSSSAVSSLDRTRVPPRSPPSSGPSSGPHRALSLSPSTTRLPLSQLSALLDDEPSVGGKPRVLGPRSPWRRTQSTPLGPLTSWAPSSAATVPAPSSRKRHTLIVVDDLPNLYHRSTRDAFQAALLAFLDQSHAGDNVPLVVLLSESAPQLGAAPEDGAGEAAAASHAGAGLAWSDRLANVWDARTLLGDVRTHPAYADVQLNPASMTLLKQALRRIIDCALTFCATESSPVPPTLPLSGQDLARAESHAGFTRVAGYAVADALARSSLTGDLRGASIALQESLRAMVQDYPARPPPLPPATAPGGKKRPRAGTKAAARLEEKEAQAQAELEVGPAMEKVAARVAGLDLWHLVGKVLYNKQEPVSDVSLATTSHPGPDSSSSSFLDRVMRAKRAFLTTTSGERVASRCPAGAPVRAPAWPAPRWQPAADPLKLWRGLTVSPADLSLFLLENTPRFTSVHEQTLSYARGRGLPVPAEYDDPSPSGRVVKDESEAEAECGSNSELDSDATQPEDIPAPTPPLLPCPSKGTGLLAASRVADALSLADAYFGSPAGGSGPGDAILIGGGKSLNPSSLSAAGSGAAEEYEFHTVVRGVTAHMPPYLVIGSDGRVSESSTEPTRYAKRPRDAPAPPKVRKPAWYAARREAQTAHADLRDALRPGRALPLATAYVSDPFAWPLLARLAKGPLTISRTASLRKLATVRDRAGDGSDTEALVPDEGGGGESDLPTASLYRPGLEDGDQLGEQAEVGELLDEQGELSDDLIEDAGARPAFASAGACAPGSEDEFEDAEWEAIALALDHT